MSQRSLKRTLDDQIAAAFLPGAVSTEVVELIGNVEAAAAASGEAAQLSRSQALDPQLSAEKVAVARREMEDAAFRRDRMQVAVTKLGERLKELKAQEENERRWAAYETAKAERDELVTELKDVYPVFAARLADLMGRIRASDEEVDRINRGASPSGAECLRSVELVARDLNGFNVSTANVPRLVRDVRLPALDHRQTSYIWPPSQ